MNEILPDFLKNKAENTPDFNLPNAYFDTFSDRFFEKLAASETTFLSEFSDKKIPIFQTPTDYFEKLPDRVFEKIAAETEVEKIGKTVNLPVKKPLFQIIRPFRAVAAAASVALLVGFGLFFNQKSSEKSTTLACNTACLSEKISEDDVQIYLAENLADFNSEELLNENLIGELDVKSVKKSAEMEFQADDADPILNEMIDDLREEDLEKML